MKLPYGVNPAHVASKDKTRYVLGGVKFSGTLAVATNGRCLVGTIATRSDDDDPRDVIVPTRAALAAFPKGKRPDSIIPALTINPKPENEAGTVTVTDRNFDRTIINEIDGNFPVFDQVFLDHTKATHKLGINVKYLADIAKALGEDALILHLDLDEFQEPYRGDAHQYRGGFYITGTKDTRLSIAILMPVRISGQADLGENQVISEVAKIKAEKSAAAELREAKAKMEAEAAAAASESTQPQTNTTEA